MPGLNVVVAILLLLFAYHANCTVLEELYERRLNFLSGAKRARSSGGDTPDLIAPEVCLLSPCATGKLNLTHTLVVFIPIDIIAKYQI